MAAEPQDQAPEGMETKDTQLIAGGDGSLIGYRQATVPHVNRTGSQLSEDERAATSGDGVAYGITSASGGTQGQPAFGETEKVETAPPATATTRKAGSKQN